MRHCESSLRADNFKQINNNDMKKRTNQKEQIEKSKSIQNKIEVLKIDYSFINYSSESASLKSVKDEISEYCQKYMPSEIISKDVISHLLGALVYSKHPDKVGEIFKGIEEILDINSEIKIDYSKDKRDRKPANYAIMILCICIVVSVLIFAFLFRYELTDKGLIIFDRWSGDFLQKRL